MKNPRRWRIPPRRRCRHADLLPVTCWRETRSRPASISPRRRSSIWRCVGSSIRARLTSGKRSRYTRIRPPSRGRGDVGEERHAQRPDDSALGVLRVLAGGVDTVEDRARFRVERLARVGDLHGTRGPAQEPDLQFGFQAANLNAERGLCDEQAPGGAGEGQILRHGAKVAELAQFHGRIFWIGRRGRSSNVGLPLRGKPNFVWVAAPGGKFRIASERQPYLV